MKRVVIFTAIATLAICAGAIALSYQTGTYEAGAQTGFTAPGIRIEIGNGFFSVARILMHETCTAPGKAAFHDFGGFQSGASATLTGSISKAGKFHSAYHDGHGGYTKVTGQIKGPKLTVSGNEASSFTPSGSTVAYSCHAKGTFHPTHR